MNSPYEVSKAVNDLQKQIEEIKKELAELKELLQKSHSVNSLQ